MFNELARGSLRLLNELARGSLRLLRVSRHSSDVFSKHRCSFMRLYAEHNLQHLWDDLTISTDRFIVVSKL